MAQGKITDKQREILEYIKKTILKKKAERKTCRYFRIGYICVSLCFYKTRNHIEYYN